MKNIFFLFFLIPSFADDFCLLLTQIDPFLTYKQDCTNVVGGANNVSLRFTADQIQFLNNNGFEVIAMANSASGTVITFKRQNAQ